MAIWGNSRCRVLLSFVLPMPVLWALIGAPASAATDAPLNPFDDAEIPLLYDRGQNVGVREEPRPEFDALGVDFGSFTIKPSVGVAAFYTDNVFGTAKNRLSDEATDIDASLLINSDWSRHALELRGGVNTRQFSTQSVKDYTHYNAAGTGRVDVGTNSQLDIGATFNRDTEDQISDAFPGNGAGQVRFRRGTLYGGGVYSGGRLRATLSAGLEILNYSNVRAFNGATIDQKFRDRNTAQIRSRVEYELSPNISTFVQANFSVINYSRDFSASFGDHNANETRVLAGASFDIAKIARGSLGLGYVRRTLRSSAIPDVVGPAGEARLEFFPSGITTITITAFRYLRESVLPDSGAVVQTGETFRVDHELLYNLLLDLSARCDQYRFDNSTRRDRLFAVGTHAEYFISPAFHLKGGYDYTDRKSSGEFTGPQFKESRFSIGLSYQL